ncbi:MAG: D-alanyl-D-alanine carboxypeptidase/D-alanyl-D-alanine-endopeptidase [Vulcanimicrobiaceae bacterium]|jgi:D-alanyl-D-alanine carboxypeptidase/D-alanyl-D-alanine-endopeptidase (penicillin-binding protein 4)
MQNDEEEERQRKVPFLLVVACDAGQSGAYNSALQGIDGVELHGSSNPAEALKWASGKTLAAVVVDEKLSSMDGVEFVRRLPVSSDAPKPHVIMLTETGKQAVGALRAAGVDDTLHKPVSRDNFASLVSSAVALRLAQGALWKGAALKKDAADAAAAAASPERRRRFVAAALAIALVAAILAASMHKHRELAQQISKIAAAPIAALSALHPKAPAKAASVPPAKSSQSPSSSAPSASNGIVGVAAAAVPAGAGIPPAQDADLAAEPVPASVAGGSGGPPKPSRKQSEAAAALGALIQNPDAGVLVLDGAGKPVAAFNPDVPRVPASTIKVLTAAAALATLGPQFRFKTQLLAHGTVRDGAIDGTLSFVGGGDPVLSSQDLDDAVSALEKRGVRRIRGDLVIDGTAFTSEPYNTHWAASDRRYPYAVGASAVSIDEGTRTRIVNGVRVADAVDDQQAYAGLVLRSRLSAHHIAVDGVTRSGRAEGGSVLWEHESPPLTELTRKMLVESDNHIAEQLLRETGLLSSGVGSESAGIAALRDYLSKHAVPMAGLQLYDGSGLSLQNRATPRTLATMLWRIGDTPEGERIRTALTRVTEPPVSARNAAYVKTGRVGTSRGLVGYMLRDQQGLLSFAFLSDGRKESAAVLASSQDRALARLTRLMQ